MGETTVQDTLFMVNYWCSSVSTFPELDCTESIIDEEDDEDFYEMVHNQSAHNQEKFDKAKFIRLQNSGETFSPKIYPTPPPSAESYLVDDNLSAEAAHHKKHEAQNPEWTGDEKEQHHPPSQCAKEKEDKAKEEATQKWHCNNYCWYSKPVQVEISTLVWAVHPVFGRSCGRIIEDSSLTHEEKDYLCKVEFFSLPKQLPRPSMSEFPHREIVYKKNCFLMCHKMFSNTEDCYFVKLLKVL
jgi:hypothetical protein